MEELMKGKSRETKKEIVASCNRLVGDMGQIYKVCVLADMKRKTIPGFD